MNCEVNVFVPTLVITLSVLFYHALSAMGVFRRIDGKLNPPVQVPEQKQPTVYDDSAIKADIEKLKLALSFKEFKR